MAENKKGFLMYADQLGIVEKMILKDRTDGTNYAGELFYHLMLYVNDRNPEPINFIIEMGFEPIKQQLKRDLKKWEVKSTDNSEKGILGNLKRWNKDLYDRVVKKEITIEEANGIAEHRRSDKQRQKSSLIIANVADTVNVNDTVNDNINYTFRIRDKIFYEPLADFISKNYNSRIQTFMMQRTDKHLLPLVLKRMEADYPRYEFNNENHLWNSFRNSWRNVSKDGGEKSNVPQANTYKNNELL